MSDEIVYQGKIVEVVQIKQKDGRVFEIGRRAPGTRLIIPSRDGAQLLLTKEHRHELDNYDFRLPGGKVFDTLEEYNAFLASGKDIIEPATAKAKAEAREEAGIDVKSLRHVYTSVNGATMKWDLYYFVVDEWEEHGDGQALELGEDITVEWYDRDAVKEMLLDGRISEDRSAAVMWRWLEGKL